MAVAKYRNDGLALATVDKSCPNACYGGSEKQSVNYDILKELCAIDGLGTAGDSVSAELAHCEFMSRYREMFSPEKQRKTPQSTFDSLAKRPAYCQRGCATDSRSSEGSVQRLPVESGDVPRDKSAHLAVLRKLLRKKTIERTREENRDIYNALRRISADPCVDFEPDVLRDLCTVAQLDAWDETGIDIDAENGFYLILSGSVRTSRHSLQELLKKRSKNKMQSDQAKQEAKHFKSQTLVAGDSFGSLEKAENKSIRSVCTCEACEFLVISAADHQRVMQKIHQKREREKVVILENCKLFADWSRQALQSVAKLIRWSKMPSGIVLAKEGEPAPLLAIIKSGQCRIICHINTRVTLPNKVQEWQRKAVEIGNIGRSEYFAEESVLFGRSMTYTVLTTSPMELAVIDASSLSDLDPVVLQLFRQSSDRMSRKISQEDVELQYRQQEMKAQWAHTKASVLNDSLRYCGIVPGVGKWKK